ncbi:hypothetical protein EV421DRAFT_1742783 [Armillaria borealis]|uniref:Uncharacterized protein n=1 Tax=Armillaria borealis TaxID=47425 RepID=A0AA39MF03_9AGAR|nr:hypothetical protein EV421DRAFT_1742783 [Armillaria borealis]
MSPGSREPERRDYGPVTPNSFMAVNLPSILTLPPPRPFLTIAIAPSFIVTLLGNSIRKFVNLWNGDLSSVDFKNSHSLPGDRQKIRSLGIIYCRKRCRQAVSDLHQAGVAHDLNSWNERAPLGDNLVFLYPESVRPGVSNYPSLLQVRLQGCSFKENPGSYNYGNPSCLRQMHMGLEPSGCTRIRLDEYFLDLLSGPIFDETSGTNREVTTLEVDLRAA